MKGQLKAFIITEEVTISDTPTDTDIVTGIATIRGEPVTLINLDIWLGHDALPIESYKLIIFCEFNGKQVGFLVKDMINIVEKTTDELKNSGKSLIITGDFNTAHNEIDLKNPGANSKRSGFLRIERDVLDRMQDKGYVDTFRYFYPDTVKYSWWSYRFNARKNNAGWRIDYFFVTRDLIDKGFVAQAFINNDIFGSDHCPVGIVLEF